MAGHAAALSWWVAAVSPWEAVFGCTRWLLSIDIMETKQHPLRAFAFVSLMVGPSCLVTPPSLVKEICLRSTFKARPPPLSFELE